MTGRGSSQLGGRLERVRAPLRRTAAHRAWRWIRSELGSRRLHHELEGVETYCLFLGHPRSGHSIVGALLDAHPEIAISDELDAVSYVASGFKRDQVLYLSVMVARDQALRLRIKQGRGGEYSYHVPGQHQGRFHRLRVVGDSRAGWTTRRLAESPRLLGQVEQLMRPSEVRFIHVVRNPFDNISTMMIRGGRSQVEAQRLYLEGCERLRHLRSRIPADRVLTIRHEDLIRLPRETLARACRFLGVDPDEEYLSASSDILFRSPSRSRDSVEWPIAQTSVVEAAIERFDFLRGYSYAD